MEELTQLFGEAAQTLLQESGIHVRKPRDTERKTIVWLEQSECNATKEGPVTHCYKGKVTVGISQGGSEMDAARQVSKLVKDGKFEDTVDKLSEDKDFDIVFGEFSSVQLTTNLVSLLSKAPTVKPTQRPTQRPTERPTRRPTPRPSLLSTNPRPTKEPPTMVPTVTVPTPSGPDTSTKKPKTDKKGKEDKKENTDKKNGKAGKKTKQ